jgi:hypothetical protein
MSDQVKTFLAKLVQSGGRGIPVRWSFTRT